jgi:hypothetical protein
LPVRRNTRWFRPLAARSPPELHPPSGFPSHTVRATFIAPPTTAFHGPRRIASVQPDLLLRACLPRPRFPACNSATTCAVPSLRGRVHQATAWLLLVPSEGLRQSLAANETSPPRQPPLMESRALQSVVRDGVPGCLGYPIPPWRHRFRIACAVFLPSPSADRLRVRLILSCASPLLQSLSNHRRPRR